MDGTYGNDMTWNTIVQDTLTSALDKACEEIQTETFTFPKQPGRWIYFEYKTDLFPPLGIKTPSFYQGSSSL